MRHVAGGFVGGHAGEFAAQRDALVERGEHPEFHALAEGVFAALDQRISLRCELTGMTPDETASYVAHHTALAGRTDTLFSADAVGLIHQTSRGLPRAVNNLAVQALLAAYAANTGIVDESSARQAVKETTA
nr:hypothetical protein [Candidatus Microthrix parvicella]